ncbi:rhodanese-like domain-containing protein [Maribacter sp. ACAM166]|uniref:rhodanese-like domain-containing protein n=1 Tax=Maribacter sp. ACAM166 TaxID=2508996 RepID=UPI0010FDFA76|nr:rhodanese-like domain-containing protein [Maribacter sp. ACAM166]TLP82211.1 rhodanese-like domain-containing protein [Maribacter sp. ACAM166]
MKNILLFILFSSAQIVVGQMESQSISEFISYDSSKEILLDVRTPNEYAEGHIDGAVNIDWFSNNFNAQVASMDKTKTIYVYCKKGGRSLKSQIRLDQLGFLHVINLDGGYDVYVQK